MNTPTQHVTLRISKNIVKELDKLAEQEDRSRSYVIGKFLKEKLYELTTAKESC